MTQFYLGQRVVNHDMGTGTIVSIHCRDGYNTNTPNYRVYAIEFDNPRRGLHECFFRGRAHVPSERGMWLEYNQIIPLEDEDPMTAAVREYVQKELR